METSPDAVELWEEKMLTETLLLTCQADGKPGYTTCNMVSGMLIAMEKPGIHVVNRQTAEMLLIERLTTPDSPVHGLQYVKDCYERLHDLSSKIYTKTPEQEKFIESTRMLLVRYFGQLMLRPAAFDSTETHASATEKLVAMLTSANPNIPSGFLINLCTSVDEASLHKIFRPVFRSLTKQMHKQTLLSSYQPTLAAMRSLTAVPQLLPVFTQCPEFVLPTLSDGSTMGIGSLLAPFLALSCMPDRPDIVKSMFGGTNPLPQHEQETAMELAQVNLKTCRTQVHDILKMILKGGETCKDAVLTWMAFILESNAARTQMHVDRRKCSSDGLLINLCGVLLLFCEPFLKPDFKKMHLVDKRYCIAPRMDMSRDTRLSATEEELAKMLEEVKKEDAESRAGKAELARFVPNWPEEELTKAREKFPRSMEPTIPFHFITESFFLTLRCMHLGIVRSVSQYNSLCRQLQTMMNEREDQARIVQTKGFKLACEAQLFDIDNIERGLKFYIFFAEWLCRLADPEGKAEALPLPMPVPKEFAAVPEYMVEDMGEFLVFVSRAKPEIAAALTRVDIAPIFKAIVVLMGSKSHITNTHLRSKLVELLCSLAPNDDSSDNRLDYLFNKKDSIMCHLSPALMELYVDIESTGRDSQFYDKFNVRYQIACLFRYLWKIPFHKQIIVERCQDREHVGRFINMLINDATYLLDESLKKLEEIHDTEELMKDTATWRAQPDRREQERHHARNEHVVRIEFLLANETIDMFNYLSKEIPEPFLTPEMAERTAQMLDFFLVTLAGPARNNLKVKRPEKYHFNPSELLKKIIDISLNFADRDEYLDAVVRDGRSFKPEIFQTAVQLLGKCDSNVERVGKFSEVVTKLLEKANAFAEEEADLGDIPDDYLDPIMQELMTDPVKLPTSGNIMERATIHRILLTEQLDPFNRAPLTEDQIEECPELKKEISDWVAKKQAEARAKREAAPAAVIEDGVAMVVDSKEEEGKDMDIDNEI